MPYWDILYMDLPVDMQPYIRAVLDAHLPVAVAVAVLVVIGWWTMRLPKLLPIRCELMVLYEAFVIFVNRESLHHHCQYHQL